MPLRAAHRLSAEFPHHTLADDEVRGDCELVDAASFVPRPQDVEDVPKLLRLAGVARVILVHGTFAGDDIMGVAREVGRFSPAFARQINVIGKRWIDELVGDVGNYTEAFAECLSGLINPPSAEPIPVTRFHWSGENHHLGRADGVMSLLDSVLIPESVHHGHRVLVMAHSHGGNVIAMLSQLVGASKAEQEIFFAETRSHYHSRVRKQIDLDDWKRVRKQLLDVHSAPIVPMDVATFGTPLRYRWNTEVCPKLLHFVQHRSLIPENPHQACLPRSVHEVFETAAGDYVQHLGIAGTDFLPSIFAWRDWVVERRMARMFESTARRRDVLKKLKLGRRESSDGTTLLVDYPDGDDDFNQKLLGHGVYTSRRWLPFHLHEIVHRFYGADDRWIRGS